MYLRSHCAVVFGRGYVTMLLLNSGESKEGEMARPNAVHVRLQIQRLEGENSLLLRTQYLKILQNKEYHEYK